MNAYFTQNDAQNTDEIFELACNLDDMLPEDIAFAMEQLLEAGALDVYTIPIGMKKNRPATMLCCLCKAGEEETFARLMLHHTTTLGVRLCPMQRLILERKFVTRQTPLGPVRYKIAGDKAKPEYDDLTEIARQNSLSILQVRKLLAQGKYENGEDQ